MCGGHRCNVTLDDTFELWDCEDVLLVLKTKEARRPGKDKEIVLVCLDKVIVGLRSLFKTGFHTLGLLTQLTDLQE